jgi:hypothetical protein
MAKEHRRRNGQHRGRAEDDDGGPQADGSHDPIDSIGLGLLRIARSVTQRAGESICLVRTLYIGRRAMMKPLSAELAARAWEFAQGLELEEYRRLQNEVRSTWPATTKLNGLDFDRAFLAFIAERWLDKAA